MVFMGQPGFGRSRPPDRDFPTDMYHRDADWGAKLMQVSRRDGKMQVNLEPDETPANETAHMPPKGPAERSKEAG